MKLAINIPDGLDFAALKIARDPLSGDVEFDWAPIELICEASGLDVELFRRGPQDNLSTLITAWYLEHRRRGGAPDQVQEDLISEVRAEDERGDGISHKPGLA